jgi:hypothetical protein
MEQQGVSVPRSTINPKVHSIHFNDLRKIIFVFLLIHKSIQLSEQIIFHPNNTKLFVGVVFSM